MDIDSGSLALLWIDRIYSKARADDRDDEVTFFQIVAEGGGREKNGGREGMGKGKKLGGTNERRVPDNGR